MELFPVFNKKLKSKKAILPLIAALEFIISLTATFLFLQVGEGVMTGTNHQKLYFVRDIPFTLDAIGSTHINMDYFYSLEGVADFYYTFENTAFSLGENERDLYAKKYPVIASPSSILIGNFSHPKGFVFSQQGGILSVHNNTGVTVNYNKEKCDPLPKISTPLFVLDPGHGGDDYGFVSGSSQESVIARELGEGVNGFFGNLLSTRDLGAEQTKTLDDKQNLFQEYSGIGGILSLHFAQEDASENNLVFYVNAKNSHYEESKAFACHLLNEFITFFPNTIKGAAIIPLDLNLLEENDPLRILDHDLMGVVIEMGNINNANNPFMKEEKDASKIIAKILKEMWVPVGAS